MATTSTKKSTKEKNKDMYFQAKGGRKSSVAIARVYPKKGSIVINEKEHAEYFKSPKGQKTVEAPFVEIQGTKTLSATVKVSGGGISAQADAVRNAIAKALVKFDESFRKPLKRAGFLTRDSRVVERKKYGLKKARRAPQWSKR